MPPPRAARSSGRPTWCAVPGRRRSSTAVRCRHCWCGPWNDVSSVMTRGCPASSSTCWAAYRPKGTCGCAARCSAPASRSSCSAPRCWRRVPTANPDRWRGPAGGAWRTRTPRFWRTPRPNCPPPRSEARNRDLKAREWDRNYVHSLDWLWLTEPLSPGPGESWIKPTVDLVNGETMTHLERLFAVADCANGIGSKIDITQWTFLNTDLAVHVFRVPDGDWIGVRAETNYGPDGIGTTVGTLFDEQGAVGAIQQSVLVRRRPDRAR